MLILKYFLTVGAVLIAGLLALNAHLAAPGHMSINKPTTASLPLVTPAVPKPDKAAVAEDVAPPQKLKKSGSPTRHSKPSRHRASR